MFWKKLQTFFQNKQNSLEERLENVLGDHMKSAISDELSGLSNNVQV